MNDTQAARMTPKVFINKILAGTATGIIVGLIPNAVLSAILKLFGSNEIAQLLSRVVLVFQMATPMIIGAIIAVQFGLQALDMGCVAGAAFVGSGVTKFISNAVHPVTKAEGLYISSGTGDLINTMITAAIAVLLVLWIGDRFGSVKVIGGPIIIGGGSALIGILLLPYVTLITTAIGDAIKTFTSLQPILMSILIGMAFAALIISPISTVAIGLAIQLNGVSAGAAAMGVAATTIVLVIHSWKTNKSGVTLAIALGGMKMLMPNLFKHPIILLPCLTTAIVSAIPVALFNVSGTPESAGFGLVGLVGPLTSINVGAASINLVVAGLVWLMVPILTGLLSRLVYYKIGHFYDEKEVFKYN